MRSYRQMSLDQREKLYVLRQEGVKQYVIAEQLGVHLSTVSRELKRNSSLLHFHLNNNHAAKKEAKNYHYLPDRAQSKTRKRRKEANKRCPLKSLPLYIYIIKGLKRGWTPELLAGRAKKLGKGSISHECIYQYMYSFEARHLHLWEYLPRAHKKRRKKQGGRKTKRYPIANRVDITLRPEEVAERRRFGDWETDSIVGKGKGAALHTNRERLSRFMMINKLVRKTAKETHRAITKRFLPLPPRLKRTNTADNGPEFALHQQITKDTGMDIYFATPYHSWERGTNENGNGLVRRWYPKGTDFDTLSHHDIQTLEDWINHRPMKCLNFNTPYEVFQLLLLKNNYCT
jgi:IS30 family transposase